jgi:hypothetical protein
MLILGEGRSMQKAAGKVRSEEGRKPLRDKFFCLTPHIHGKEGRLDEHFWSVKRYLRRWQPGTAPERSYILACLHLPPSLREQRAGPRRKVSC